MPDAAPSLHDLHAIIADVRHGGARCRGIHIDDCSTYQLFDTFVQRRIKAGDLRDHERDALIDLLQDVDRWDHRA